MNGECIIPLAEQDLRALAAVFDCQPGALPVIVYEACMASVMRAAESDEWDEDRLPTYDEYPLVDLDQQRLIFIPNFPARDLMDWLASTSADMDDGAKPGGKRLARTCERLAQAIGAKLGYEIDTGEPTPSLAATA
jgi:hypothetical protein